MPAAVLVTATDAPDRGAITLQAGGHGLDGFPGRHGKDDAGVLHLEEGQMATACHGLQDRSISGGDRHGTRSSATHGNTAAVPAGAYP